MRGRDLLSGRYVTLQRRGTFFFSLYLSVFPYIDLSSPLYIGLFLSLALSVLHVDTVLVMRHRKSSPSALVTAVVHAFMTGLQDVCVCRWNNGRAGVAVQAASTQPAAPPAPPRLVTASKVASGRPGRQLTLVKAVLFTLTVLTVLAVDSSQSGLAGIAARQNPTRWSCFHFFLL